MARVKDIKDWITDDGLDKIEKWAEQGLIHKDIAKNMGIGDRTLYRWRQQEPAIMAALKKGNKIADEMVVSALFKRATGYEYDEKVQYPPDEQGESKTLISEKVAHPDTTAAIFWLKNRDPENWRDRKHTEITASVTNISDIADDVNAALFADVDEDDGHDD